MATVIQQPTSPHEESSGIGMILGIILAVLLILAFFVFFLPALRNQTAPVDRLDINLEERSDTESPEPRTPAPTPQPQQQPQAQPQSSQLIPIVQ